MNATRLILRSLAFYWRTHLGVVLGSAVASAVIVGALVVGDSVKQSLHDAALLRLGETRLSMATGDRFFTTRLMDALADDVGADVAPVLTLDGVARLPNTQRRVPVRVHGVDDRFWKLGRTAPPIGADAEEVVAISERVRVQLGMTLGQAYGSGDASRLLIDVVKPSALSRDMAISDDKDNALRVSPNVSAVIGDDQFAQFSLVSGQSAALNVFVPLRWLQEEVELEGRVNTALVGPTTSGDDVSADAANEALAKHWSLEDARVIVRALDDRGVIDLSTPRIFIDRPVAEAAARGGASQQILTYFVRRVETEDGRAFTPYAIVAAHQKPDKADGATSRQPLPPDMRDDQIVIVQDVADTLGVGLGDKLTLHYDVMAVGRAMEPAHATFSIAAIVPTESPGGDRELMPDLPGLKDADTPLQWQAPRELGIDPGVIRMHPEVERYWEQHRGAPKAFVTLNWAQNDGRWSNPYGDLTTVRWPIGVDQSADDVSRRVLAELDPAALGFRFLSSRNDALEATRSGTGSTFGYLFISLSLFLIVAALLLTGLLFVLGVEQRATETGTLLALGLTPKRVRRLWLIEGGVLAAVGSALGVPLGIGYTKAVLWALQSLWAGAVAGASITYHVTVVSIVIGALSGLCVAVATMAWVLRRQARRPARVLLSARLGLTSDGQAAGGARRRWSLILAVVLGVGAVVLAIVGAGGDATKAAGVFFGAGAMLLIAALLFSAAVLGGLGGGGRGGGRAKPQAAGGVKMSLVGLGLRNSGRRRGRSLATVMMLACGAFLVVAVNAFRQDASHDAHERSAGTGGFLYWVEASLPVYKDLNDPSVRELIGFEGGAADGVRFVPMRRLAGDDASCLNLNKPTNPPLLGVAPDALADRGAFTFSKREQSAKPQATGGEGSAWSLLSEADDDPDAPVPAVVDDSVATWVLYKGLGDTIDYVDEKGQAFEVKIVGTLANSILQGHFVISERQFLRRFPTQGGYRVLLLDGVAKSSSGDGAAAASVPSVDRDGLLQAIDESDLAEHGLVLTPARERLAAFYAVENTYLTIFAVLGGLGLLLGSVGLGVLVARNVLERRNELALMRAVGFTGATLGRLLLWEHWLLVLLGLGAGVIAALLAVAPALGKPGADMPIDVLGASLGAIVVSAVVWTALATWFTLRGRLTDALRSE